MAVLAMTPPMGWNAWNYFGYGAWDEKVIYDTADAMVEKGFRDAGYTYLCIDDTWMCRGRDANGDLIPNPDRFPSGMKALGDYLHERGLKFGLYAGAGVLTYAGCEGSFGHERQDAKKFAEWGVDLLKYDFGYVAPGNSIPHLFRRMGQALRESGRDILYSGCYGKTEVTEWMRSVGCGMWRLSGDIEDRWDSIVRVARNAMTVGNVSGPCGWNDPDMMVVGLDGKGYVGQIGGGCTRNEYEAHFAMWCMLAAPLLMGHDVRNTTDEIAEILLNRELIAINQDPLGIQGYCLPPMSNNDLILAKPLDGGDLAFCMVNETDADKKMILSWHHCGWEMTDRVRLRDVIHHTELGEFSCGTYAVVPPHSAVVYRATRI